MSINLYEKSINSGTYSGAYYFAHPTISSLAVPSRMSPSKATFDKTN